MTKDPLKVCDFETVKILLQAKASANFIDEESICSSDSPPISKRQMSVLMDPSVKNYQKLVKSAKQFMRDEIEKVSQSLSVIEGFIIKFNNASILIKTYILSYL